MLAKIKSLPTKKPKIKILTGIVHINTTYNNTIVTLTDHQGNVISWSSAGSNGFKGSRKATAFAAQIASEKLTSNVINFGLKKVEIFVKGIGPGRESAIRAVKKMGVKVIKIKDITPLPHNGCRPPKKRRL